MSAGGVNPVYNFCRAACHGFLRLYCRFRVSHLERVPAGGAAILACNHASYLDPPLLGCAVRGRMIRYMARDSLFRFPVMGWLLRQLGVVPLARERGDVGALRKGLKILKEGGLLAVFPEGTRSPDGEIRQAKAGIGFLVARAGVPVIPAHLRGSFAAWPKGARFPRPRPVSLVYGPPITPAEIAKLAAGEQPYERITALVMDRIRALRDATEPPPDS